MDDDRWDEQVGSVAEEAQRLLESLRRTGDPSDDPSGDGQDADAGAGEGADPDRRGGDDGAAAEDEAWVCTEPFCRSCPLCRTAAVVRGLSPETLRRLSDLATVAAGVLSDLAGERDRRAGSDHAPDGDDPEKGPSRPGGAAASRPIPVHDADDGSGSG